MPKTMDKLPTTKQQSLKRFSRHYTRICFFKRQRFPKFVKQVRHFVNLTLWVYNTCISCWRISVFSGICMYVLLEELWTRNSLFKLYLNLRFTGVNSSPTNKNNSKKCVIPFECQDCCKSLKLYNYRKLHSCVNCKPILSDNYSNKHQAILRK